MKYLGIHIDRKLTSKKYTEETARKANARINQFHAIIRRRRKPEENIQSIAEDNNLIWSKHMGMTISTSLKWFKISPLEESQAPHDM